MRTVAFDFPCRVVQGDVLSDAFHAFAFKRAERDCPESRLRAEQLCRSWPRRRKYSKALLEGMNAIVFLFGDSRGGI